jgi:hypothetical protein
MQDSKPPPFASLAFSRTFLPQLRLPLLDRSHDHITDTRSGKSVESCTDTLDGDDVQIAGPGVVCAGHDGSDGEAERHLQFVAGCAAASGEREELA